MGPGLWTLFVSAFISSTLLPGGSEAVLVYLALKPSYSLLELLLVATIGNTLGGMTTWGLGRLLASRVSYERLKREELRRAVKRMRTWGAPSLLLSWVPVIGDPLCFAAGWVRVSPIVALACIAAGKALRYALILEALR